METSEIRELLKKQKVVFDGDYAYMIVHVCELVRINLKTKEEEEYLPNFGKWSSTILILGNKYAELIRQKRDELGYEESGTTKCENPEKVQGLNVTREEFEEMENKINEVVDALCKDGDELTEVVQKIHKYLNTTLDFSDRISVLENVKNGKIELNPKEWLNLLSEKLGKLSETVEHLMQYKASWVDIKNIRENISALERAIKQHQHSAKDGSMYIMPNEPVEQLDKMGVGMDIGAEARRIYVYA